MNASRKSAGVRKAAAWEDRHANDARGSLADNASGLPDRSAALPEGSPGETPMLHAEVTSVRLTRLIPSSRPRLAIGATTPVPPGRGRKGRMTRR